MENLKEIIAEAKKRECWSQNHRFNYGPINYLRDNILYKGNWEDKKLTLFQRLIRFVTDPETYFISLLTNYDYFVDCGQIYWDMKQSFPEVSRLVVWKWIKEHKEEHNILC